MATEKSRKIPVVRNCILCDYHTSSKKDFTKHENTRKHYLASQCNIIATNSNIHPPISQITSSNPFQCQVCTKIYHHRSSFWRHSKTCQPIDKNLKKTELLENIFTPDMITNLIHQNKDLQSLLIEQNNRLIEQTTTILDQNNKLVEQNKLLSEDVRGTTVVVNNSTNSNVTNNSNQFNLNFFLNEQCKNAVNMVDFLNSLKVTVKDLENTGQLGYVDGISRIFVNGLLDMDVSERPVHCSDLKRETVYVRDDNKWNKDDPEKNRMKKAVQRVAQKNLQQIREWISQHPECKDTRSPESDIFVTLSQHATGGSSTQENNRLEDKIMKNVLKSIVINKSAVSL